MTTISCRQASAEELEAARDWTQWESGDIDTYRYRYDQNVQYIVLSGEAVIHSPTNPPIAVSAGSLVNIAEGVDAEWVIHQPLVNLYQYR